MVELLTAVFPHLAGLPIRDVFTKGSPIRVHAETGVAAMCPACTNISRRAHSRYERRLFDAAVGGRQAIIHLQVRPFFCDAADFLKMTFAEQVDGLTVRHGRHGVLAAGGRRASRWRWAAGPVPG